MTHSTEFFPSGPEKWVIVAGLGVIGVVLLSFFSGIGAGIKSGLNIK